MKQNKSPAFQFYPRDFLSCSSVTMMSNEAVGCYIKLLCHCWLEGGIPNDPKRIALLCGIDGKRMTKIWPQIQNRFVDSVDRDGFIVNERLEKERQNQIDNREKRSNSGKKGADARWQTHSNAIDLPMAKNGSASASASASANKNGRSRSHSSSNNEASESHRDGFLEEIDRIHPIPEMPVMPKAAAGSMLKLEERVRALKADWKIPLTRMEQEDLMGCARALEGLSDDDWRIIRDYLHTKIPKGDPGWQPRSRGKFLQSAPDVWAHASEWHRKNFKPKKEGIWR